MVHCCINSAARPPCAVYCSLAEASASWTGRQGEEEQGVAKGQLAFSLTFRFMLGSPKQAAVALLLHGLLMWKTCEGKAATELSHCSRSS